MLSVIIPAILTIATLILPTNGANVLVLNPYISGSHFAFLRKLTDLLADDGHNVTMIINELDTKNFSLLTKKANVVIRSQFSSNPQLSGSISQSFWDDGYDIFNAKPMMNQFRDEFEEQCERLLTDKAFAERIKLDHYDIALVEPTDFCGYGFLKLIGLNDYVNIIPMALSETFALASGLPGRNYEPFPEMIDYHPGMSYFERLTNYVLPFIRFNYQGYEPHGLSAPIIRKYVDPEFTSSDAIGNARFTFLNTEEHIDFPRPISHKIIYIGGITVPQSSADALPDDYKKIFEESKRGVVLVSFGSIAKSSGMPERIRQSFLDMFAAFPDISFIWKFENESDTVADDLSNVFKKEWVPQTNILSQPKLLAFVTHGGMNSVIESAHAGVPLLGIPLFLDQSRNIRMLEYRKSAVLVEKNSITSEVLISAMHKLTDDNLYKKRAQTIAVLAHSKPMSGKQRFISYFNHAVQFVHADHLDIAHRKLNVFWYYNLDIFSTLVVVGVALLIVLFKIISVILSYFSYFVSRKKVESKKRK